MTRFAQGRQEEPPLSALIETLRVPLSPPSLRLALTHRSFAYENGGLPTNERLEFLGDSILGQAITVKLFRDHPELAEGDLAKRRSSLVSSAALAEAARAIQLGQYIRLGRGESLTGGADKPSILADTLEAIIGATFIDCGPDIATALVLRLLAPLMEDDTRFGVAMDPKTSLQEMAAKIGAHPPAYTITASGPDHNKRFVATVTVGEHVTATGEGVSKKQAEMAAALAAWTQLSPQGSQCERR
ncbi:MAG: ribonuclease III [Candidatus Lumbricidophila eiseniae]|uniref:Ribonuclease 3 n=1 Tax=Candidatus Lumbricidiphila eiseniae TaxID=1969409 RepID=A0A2A6FTQ9_9MICO|nr:MAG: ribonuclease III [Candidatus Lumbricidophila eiseniae]